MNGSSNEMFSKSWQRPGNLAMMASVVSHGVLFAGLALVPASGQQAIKKQLRVVSLLQASPSQPAQSNQPIDPNAPPPAPGVAGLPLNITTPDGLAELPVTNTPNPAFDPFASSIVELPPPPPQTSFTPFDPDSLAAAPPPRPSTPPQASPSGNPGPSLSDEDFQRWLNGTADLPNLPPDPGASGPLPSPGVTPGPVASGAIPPNPVGGVNSNSNNSASGNNRPPFESSIAPPASTIERYLAYDYPKAACSKRLEGKAEYRIWVSSQAKPVVSDIVVSTESPILDRAVKLAAQKYKIKAEDANKIVVLPFDIKYSQKACAVKEPVSPPPTFNPDPTPSTPTPIPPTPKPVDPSGQNLPSQPLSPTSPSPTSQPNPPVVPPTQPTLPSTPQPPVQPAQPFITPQPSAPPPAAPTPPSPVVPPVQPAVPSQAPPSNAVPPQPPVPAAPLPPAEVKPPAAPTPPNDAAPPTIEETPAN